DRRYHDLHRHSPIHCFIRRASGDDFDVVIAACLEICLETPRNIFDAPVSIWALHQIDYLSSKRLCSVNSATVKSDGAEKILSALMNRNDDVNLTTLLLKFVTRRIHH